MVAAVRRGRPMRAVARAFRVSLSLVQYWVRRAGRRRLDRVDWGDRSRRPHRTRRTPRALEDHVVTLRGRLKRESALGEYGAPAIERALVAEGRAAVPSVRTIGRILERRGALDGRPRRRRAPPPPGWYLPAVARGEAELDSFDIIEGLALAGGRRFEVLTGVSLHGGRAAAWPMAAVSARAVVPLLVRHWGAVGLPGYAQFDNDTIFQGAHQHRDSVSRVVRLCLALTVVPVFAPVQETGFQAAIESFNGRWQAKVWERFTHANLRAVQHRSARYLRAQHERAAARLEAAPPRRPLAPGWEFDVQQPPRGTIVFLRRTTAAGAIELLGRRFPVDRHWLHRLVRAEVDLTAGEIRVHALRRREPADQPLLCRLAYVLPPRRFRDRPPP
jgi:hypothetical protein